MNRLTRSAVVAAAAATIPMGLATAPGQAVGEGPNYGGHGQITTSSLTTYSELADFLRTQDARQDAMDLTVIGQSVKGRDLFLASWVSDADNPTILYLTQQHGNEQLTTQGAMDFIRHLGTGRGSDVLDGVNILVVPMLNPDGAMGDVNFDLHDYIAKGDRHLTRYNANGVDLNRDHVVREQPETRALHENVLGAYDVDYMIDMHHQGAYSAVEDEFVSGSILYPTTPNVDPEVREGSKRLGSVLYDAVDSKGWGLLGKYVGGTAETISRNGLAVEYGISTLLMEMRGMADHERESYVLGQRGSGYLVKQATTAMEATAAAIADGSIEDADTSFWDTLPEQYWNEPN